jgi:hypothetical protein
VFNDFLREAAVFSAKYNGGDWQQHYQALLAKMAVVHMGATADAAYLVALQMHRIKVAPPPAGAEPAAAAVVHHEVDYICLRGFAV